MKKTLLTMLLLIACLLPGIVSAQTTDTVVVGTGTNDSYAVAFHNYYNNSWEEIHYAGSEIGRIGLIQSVGFNVSTASSFATESIKIYMGVTSNHTFVNGSSWTPESELTLVYSSTNQTIGATTGWQRFNLQTPYAYTDTSLSLVVVVSRHSTNYSSALKWKYSTATNAAFYRRGDAQGMGYEDHPGTNSGTLNSNRANISLVMSDIADDYCFAPSQVAISNITSNSADLTWQPGGSESSYNVAIGEPGFNPDSVNAVSVSSTSYAFTNLLSNHNYQYAVQSVCSEPSVWRMGQFRTNCAELTSSDLPYTQNFSGDAYPICWNKIGTATIGVSNGKAQAYSYSYNATAYLSMHPVASDVDLTGLQVRFGAYHSTYPDILEVGVMDDPNDATTFEVIDTVNMSTQMEEYEISLANYTGNGQYVTFRITSSGYMYTYIDDVNLEVLPLCPRATNPTLTRLSSTEFDLSWNAPVDANPNGYTVYYSTTNAFSDTCLSEVVYDTFCTISNLLPQTTYYAWIVSNCTEGNSSLREVGAITTECASPNLPYVMDFEGLASNAANGSIPQCWKWISGYAVGSNPCPHGAFAHNSSVSLSLYMSSGTSTPIPGMGNLIALPAFEDLNTLALSFYAYQETNNPCDVFVVGVMEGNDFIPYDTIVPAFDTYTEYMVNFSNYQGTGMRPAFRAYRASGSMHIYVDDITVDLIPDCANPTNIHTTSLQSSEATIAWNGDENSTYEVYYDTAAVEDYADLYSMETAYTNSIDLYGLDPATTYHIYVRTICSNGYSNWGHGVFTTNVCDNMCQVQILMHDSFGDGWNGNKIKVYQQNILMGEATIASGSDATATISICPDDTVNFVWSAGSYATETSFTMKDNWDNILYACDNGANISGTFFNWVTNCQAPDCPAPLNLSASGIDSASAWIHWFDTVNTSWIVEYDTVGFVLGQGMTVTVSNEDSVQLTGLSAITNYQVYVRAICGDTLITSQPFTFRTGCGIITMYPYTEGFEGYGEGVVPMCWTQLENVGVNPCVSVASYVAHNGSNILSMWHSSATQKNTIATPMFDDLSGKQLKFWARYNGAAPLFSVGVLDANGSYVPMDTITPTSDYTQYTYDLTNWATEGNQVVFHTTCTSGSQILYVDDVTIDLIPDCLPISEIHTEATLATTTSVTVAWTDTNNAEWEYIFDSVAISNAGAYSPAFTTTNPLTISNLNAGTTYHIYVRPSCIGVTPWSHVVATTRVCDGGCDVEVVMHDSYGDGWNGNKIVATQNGITMGEATITAGTYGTALISICPNIPIQFNFQTGSFATETSFELNDAWGNELYTCTNGNSVGNSNFFTYTTNCQAPTCLAPKHLNANSITSNSANLTWFDTMATSWTVKYDTAQFAPETSTSATTLSAQDTTIALTGLLPQTTYFVYVQANCTDTTIWSNVYNFTTGCAEINTVPWSDSFEGIAATNQNGQFGQCWTVLQNYGGNPCPYGGFPNTGSSSVSMYAYSGTNTFALPAFESLDGLQFSFYGYTESANACDLFTVGVLDANDNYVPMDTITLGNTYGFHVVVLDNYALIGNRVAVSATRNSGAMHVYVDDFVIDSISNCLPVNNLTASNATTSSVELNWSNMTGTNPMGYIVEYGAPGFAHGQGTTLYTTTHPITISNLPSSSTYQFYVRAICSATDTALWSSAAMFSTECDIVNITSTESFFEGFEANDAPANCWNMVYANASHPSGNNMIHTTDQAQEGSRSFRFSSYSSGTPYDQYLVTPELNASDSLMLSFFARRSSSNSNESFRIGYSENSNDPSDSSWVWGDTFTDAPYDSWAQYTDTFPATAKYIGIHYFSNFLYYLYIDSFLVTTNGGGCGAPRNLSETHDYANATISWTGSGNNYEVAIKTASAGVWPAETAVQGYTYTFNNLNPATTYQFRVRQNCEEGVNSAWAMGSFTTDSLPCFAPTALQATAAGTSAQLSWTPGTSETQWIVRVWNNTFEDSTLTSNNPYTINGLTPGTQYNAAVKAYCGNGAEISDWSESITFTTETCAPVTNVAANNVTATSATISWTAGSNNNGTWEINYGPAGIGQGEGTVVTVTDNPYIITGLVEEMSYDVYVRAICGDNFVSAWSAKTTFTTPAGGTTPEGIDDVNGLSVNIYPNPATTSATITLAGVEGEVMITLVDMSGRSVSSQKVECASATCVNTINVTDLAQGAYFVRISGNGINTVKKLIVK